MVSTNDDPPRHVFCRIRSSIIAGYHWRCIWCGVAADDTYAEHVGLEELNSVEPCLRGELKETEYYDT